jgi:hypothetical protein
MSGSRLRVFCPENFNQQLIEKIREDDDNGSSEPGETINKRTEIFNSLSAIVIKH